jgi:hypothetical protein
MQAQRNAKKGVAPNCLCGNQSVGWRTGGNVCARCAEIESKLATWSRANVMDRRVDPLEGVNTRDIDRAFNAWCKRRGLSFEVGHGYVVIPVELDLL